MGFYQGALLPAGRGLKQIYLSQLLGTGGVVCILLGLVAVSLLQVGVGAILTIAAGIVGLAGLVLYLAGLAGASKTHPGFKTALIIVAVTIVVAVVKGFVKEEVLSAILEIVSTALDVATVHFVCGAAAALLRGAGDEPVAAQGERVREIHLACGGVVILCSLLGMIPALAETAGALIVELVILAAELVGLVVYIRFLKSASASLIAAAGATV